MFDAYSQVKVEVAVRFCKRYSLKIPFIVWYLHSCGTSEDLLGICCSDAKRGRSFAKPERIQAS